jgi:spermidine/putrescine transport system substrate-binding protein
MPPLPRQPHRRRPNRRQFLRTAALLAAGGPATVALLDSCSRGGKGTDEPTDLQIATPDNPVTWDITPDNSPIANGLSPEKNATLRIYTYPDYIGPTAITSFEDKYGVRVEVSTFSSTDYAIDKLSDGAADFDIYTPSYDQIGRLVAGGMLRPLNHSYVPNIANVWPNFSDPWYDKEWRYTVALHRVHNRYRLADRPDTRRHRRSAQSL